MNSQMDKGLSINEVAIRKGVTYSRILQIIKEGKLKTYKLPGRRTRIKESEYQRYLREQEKEIQ